MTLERSILRRRSRHPLHSRFCVSMPIAIVVGVLSLGACSSSFTPASGPDTGLDAGLDSRPDDPGSALRVWPESRNRVATSHDLPVEWSVDDLDQQTGPVVWRANLGSETYGGPTVGNGRVLVGTNNQAPRQREHARDGGVLMAFSSDDGAFLWQRFHDKAAEPEAHDWPEQGLCSAPTLSNDRIYYLSNDGKVVATDTSGVEVFTFDLVAELGVEAHFMSTSSPLRVGRMLLVGTSNGPDEQGSVPAPAAPSLVALDAEDGTLLWQAPAAGPLFEGQWSSPTFVRPLSGVDQVAFGGGDGVLRGFSLDGETLWQFDINATLDPPPGDWERGAVIATPVWYDDLLLVASGRNPETASGRGQLLALRIDADGATLAWRFRAADLGFALATVSVGDGLVYLADLNGFVFCLELTSGRELWRYDSKAAIWASPLLADGKVYVADTDGDVTVLRHGTELEVLAETSMGEGVYASPVALDGMLYIATRSHLYALRGRV